MTSLASRAAHGAWIRVSCPEEGPLSGDGWRYVTRGGWVVDVYADRAEISGWPSGATRKAAYCAVRRVLMRIEEENGYAVYS